MGWQDAVAIGAVVAAGLYLLSLVVRGAVGGKSAGCGTSCGKCSSSGEGPGQVVTTISPPPGDRRPS